MQSAYSRQTQIRKLLPQDPHKGLADLVLQIILLILDPLLNSRVPANGTDINHAIPELQKGASLHGDIQIGHVVQDELHQFLVFIFTEPFDEGVRGEREPRLVGCEAVLCEAEVEEGRYGRVGRAKLLVLLGIVGAADVAYCTLLAELVEEIEHLRSCMLQVKIGQYCGLEELGLYVLGGQGIMCHLRRRGRLCLELGARGEVGRALLLRPSRIVCEDFCRRERGREGGKMVVAVWCNLVQKMSRCPGGGGFYMQGSLCWYWGIGDPCKRATPPPFPLPRRASRSR
jgi:hypothetical protein